MKCDELKVYVPQDGPWGLEPEEGGKLVEEETCYLKSEVDEAIAELKAKLEDVQASAYAESVDSGMENRRLKEERRWRKCSDEMPSADEGYFIILWEDKFPDIGYIGAEDDVIETIRDRGEGHSVEWWMPIPSAPKEAK